MYVIENKRYILEKNLEIRNIVRISIEITTCNVDRKTVFIILELVLEIRPC